MQNEIGRGVVARSSVFGLLLPFYFRQVLEADDATVTVLVVEGPNLHLPGFVPIGQLIEASSVAVVLCDSLDRV
jgi:hypothetical protein